MFSHRTNIIWYKYLIYGYTCDSIDQAECQNKYMYEMVFALSGCWNSFVLKSNKCSNDQVFVPPSSQLWSRLALAISVLLFKNRYNFIVDDNKGIDNPVLELDMWSFLAEIVLNDSWLPLESICVKVSLSCYPLTRVWCRLPVNHSLIATGIETFGLSMTC